MPPFPLQNLQTLVCLIDILEIFVTCKSSQYVLNSPYKMRGSCGRDLFSLVFFLCSAALNISRGTIWLSDEMEGPSDRLQCQEQWTHQRQMEQIYNWCQFQGVCGDEWAWSQGVLNIWSRTWCYCRANNQAWWRQKVWQMDHLCSTLLMGSLNMIV